MEVDHSCSLKDPSVHSGQKCSGMVFKQAVIISLLPRVTEFSVANISLQTSRERACVSVCVFGYTTTQCHRYLTPGLPPAAVRVESGWCYRDNILNQQHTDFIQSRYSSVPIERGGKEREISFKFMLHTTVSRISLSVGSLYLIFYLP